MNEVVGDDGDPSCPSRAVSGFISNEIIIYLLDEFNCYFIFIIINYCKLPSPALFGTKFCFVLWLNFMWYESQSQKDIWRISLGVKGECMWAINNGMAFIRSLRTFHNNMLSVISHQTKKIGMKANFYLFSIVNVNRRTLSSSYCNDCQDIISPPLNDRPIFSYRHWPIPMMVITKAA